MIAHSLVNRTADFLKQFPPFSYLPQEVLSKLSASVQVRYVAQHEYLFRQGNPSDPYFYVLQKGQIEIQQEQDGEIRVIDFCDVGDSFAVRAMLTGNPYIATAKAVGETLVYVIPKDQFQPLLDQYGKVALYYASGFAAGQTVVRSESDPLSARRSLRQFKSGGLFQEEDVIVIRANENVVFCQPSQTVEEVATIMAEYRIGSVVVADTALYPVGIVTNTDFTRKIGTGKAMIKDPVSAVMSGPVLCVPNGMRVSEVVLTMMRHNVRHLVVTEDGTDQSRFVGIISEHDVLLSQGNNPAILVKRMNKTRNLDELHEIRDRAESLIRQYLEQEISIEFITSTATEINDALINRCLALSIAELDALGKPAPDVSFCWISLGSEGRGEQLLRTDQDNALIYADGDHGEEVRQWFLELGKRTTDKLEACGFAHCPGEIMASNPKWNQSLAGWKRVFSDWIDTPDPGSLMHSTIFFDYRGGHGDQTLLDELSSFLHAKIGSTPNFLAFLAQNALQNPPPLSFFKQFIVERSGDHRNEFDIKSRGMMPLADAARLLLLSHAVSGITNTVQRYEQLAELEPPNAGLYREAAMAYELMIRYRAVNGFAREDSGRFLSPDSLNKIERQTLRYAFRTIEEIQSLLKTRFSLSTF